MDCSPPGSSVHGILQVRILEWVAISSSRESSPPRDQTHVSCVSCISCVSCTDWEAESLPLSHLGNNSSKWLSGLLPFQSVTIWWLTYPWKFFLLSFKCLTIVFTISKCVCAHTYTGMYMHKFFFSLFKLSNSGGHVKRQITRLSCFFFFFLHYPAL